MGWAYFIWVLSFLAENQHFGWNVTPHTDMELIADQQLAMMALLICLANALRSKR